MDKKEIKVILEALLLASETPLTIKKANGVFDSEPGLKMVENCLMEIQLEWKGRGLDLVRTSLGWRFQTKEKYSDYIQRLHPERPTKHSRALLETLAIIAYRQPVTRADIEAVRGVSVSSQIVRNLEEKGWIESVGRKDVLGRPLLYATTKSFLADLGLQSLKELPIISQNDGSNEKVLESSRLL